MKRFSTGLYATLMFLLVGNLFVLFARAEYLIWPVGVIPGEDIAITDIGLPDVDNNGVAYDCSVPGYKGHQGTDINISWAQMDAGVPVYAAADGIVLWVFDGKYDRCPDPSEPDCQDPGSGWFVAGESNGYRVCTELGNYCSTGDCCCFWCFDGGNVVVIRHYESPDVFATRYDHLKKNSILVKAGDAVVQGQKIAEVGSAGNSTGPHLHFEVWATNFYTGGLTEPWAGPCGPRYADSLWKYNPPWNDSLVPAPPTGLRALYVPPTDRIRLSWTDNASDEAGYFVERRIRGGAVSLSWVKIATLPAGSVGYIDSVLIKPGLLEGSYSYYYRVSAYNASGKSKYCYAGVSIP